jgi:hypothetical protein
VDTAAPATATTPSADEIPDVRGIKLSELAKPGTRAAGAVASVVARVVGDLDGAGQGAYFSFNSAI